MNFFTAFLLKATLTIDPLTAFNHEWLKKMGGGVDQGINLQRTDKGINARSALL